MTIVFTVLCVWVQIEQFHIYYIYKQANILNEQFVSAFTHENTTYISDMGQSEIPSMSNITVDWNLRGPQMADESHDQESHWKQLLQN